MIGFLPLDEPGDKLTFSHIGDTTEALLAILAFAWAID